MPDRQLETQYYPPEFLIPSSLGTVLCVAPHPDDEVYGPGGLLALLVKAGNRVDVLILSQGERARGDASASMGEVRVQESRRAAEQLGLAEPRFLDWPDRGMRYGEPLIAAITDAIDHCTAETLLLPALSEPHPDHQAVALAGQEAARRHPTLRTVLFYEVGAPMHPNALVDITSVAERKWRSGDAFKSQAAIQPYDSLVRALAALRAFGRGPDCQAAEAYFRVDTAQLREQGAGAAMPSWPMVRVHQGLANAPVQLPLVSVLVRSMDRPELADAVACVAAQTYPNLELVVVNASGRPHSPIQCPSHRMSCKLVEPEPGHGRPCDRARAANLALQSASGEYAIFLDDDDLLDPIHIDRLVDACRKSPAAVAAYSGVVVRGDDGQVVRNYDLPWSPHRLKGLNFLPIHAVLFRLDRVRAAAVDFDETLPVLEDWQFWLDVSSLGGFVHCEGVSAVYRQGRGQSEIGNPESANYWATWHRTLLERNVARMPSSEIVDALAWHALTLDRVETRDQTLAQQLIDVEGELQASQSELQASQSELQASQSDLQTSQSELQAMRATLQSRDEQLNAAENALEARGAHLEATQSELLARNEQLQAMQSELRARNDQVEATQSELLARSQQLLATQSELQARIEQLQLSQSSLQEKNAALRASQEATHARSLELRANQVELQLSRAELAMIKNSRSWRLTSWLRAVNARRRSSRK